VRGDHRPDSDRDVPVDVDPTLPEILAHRSPRRT
jgi:hypothetical protein